MTTNKVSFINRLTTNAGSSLDAPPTRTVPNPVYSTSFDLDNLLASFKFARDEKDAAKAEADVAEAAAVEAQRKADEAMEAFRRAKAKLREFLEIEGVLEDDK